ncbi:MAG: hypothetical protein ACXW3P_11655 [Rhodospirillales bacterium]
MIIPDSQLRVLEELAVYRYLIPRQLIRLGICRSLPYLYAILRDLETGERPLIRKIEYGVHPTAGRLAKVLYLTRQGAELLADYLSIAPETAFYPKQHNNPYRNDYFHRTATIDVQIELNRFAAASGFALPYFHAYFHKTGANRGTAPHGRLQAMTKVRLASGAIVPDAIFRLDPVSGPPWLFALEIKNGADTGAALRQIEGHIRALEDGALSARYGFAQAHRTLFVFSRYWHGTDYRSAEGPMYAVMRALAERTKWAAFLPCFAFTTLERLTTDVANEWFYVRANGVNEQGSGGMFDAGGSSVAPR